LFMAHRTAVSGLTLLAVVAIAVPSAGLGAPADSVRREILHDLWVTNGTVNAIARSGNRLYVGGTFSRVGPAAIMGGGSVGLDPRTALSIGLPAVFGNVRAVAPDGAGGWYIGGEFDAVGGEPRANLAHILSNRTLSSWNPGANGTVWALAIQGSIVYAGGEFTSAGGQGRSNLAAIDAVTGDAANMAADVDMNFGNLDQNVGIETSSNEASPRPRSAQPRKTSPAPAAEPASNAVTNAE